MEIATMVLNIPRVPRHSSLTSFYPSR